jgi:CheY-like chemotaxis protein
MGKKIKVLVADDEQDFRQLMTVWLESKGYSVQAAQDGQSALDAIRTDPPDIVFLDINMPGMDGNETLKRIRAFNKTIPVIIISAYLEKFDMRLSSRYKVSGIFYKGEDFDKGLLLLQAALRAHKDLKKAD